MCLKLHTLCQITHCVSNYTLFVKLHILCNIKAVSFTYPLENFTLDWIILHNQRLWWLWQIWSMARHVDIRPCRLGTHQLLLQGAQVTGWSGDAADTRHMVGDVDPRPDVSSNAQQLARRDWTAKRTEVQSVKSWPDGSALDGQQIPQDLGEPQAALLWLCGLHLLEIHPLTQCR